MKKAAEIVVGCLLIGGSLAAWHFLGVIGPVAVVGAVVGVVFLGHAFDMDKV